MPKIEPLQAIHYPAEPGGDLSTKIAPPYDVLDEGPKQQLLDRDGHNIVAVDLPVTPPKTVGPDEAYEEAGSLLRAWLSSGVLVRDASPALFAYEQVWAEAGGAERRRRGFFAKVEAEPFGRRGGGVHRHEMTIKSGTDDRLKLMEATAAQLSPVFGVYGDPEARFADLLEPVFKRAPDFTGRTDHDDVTHRCWAIRDADEIGALVAAMETTDVFIADGHHRYTTALNYRAAHPDQPLAQGCLMVLVACEDPGMIVRPTHRVLTGLRDFSVERLAEILEADGRFTLAATDHGVDDLAGLESTLPSSGHHAIGLYDPAEKRTHRVVAKDADPLGRDLPGKAEVWRRLDVAVFHELLVDRLMRPAFGGDSIAYKYPHELSALRELTHESAGRLGVVMQPTPLESVLAVSLAGEVMPPKSTFFFPKLATGLVINPLG